MRNHPVQAPNYLRSLAEGLPFHAAQITASVKKMSSDPDTGKLKSHSSSGTVKKKPRSRSTPRTNDVDKPRKKRHASATHSFASIPNAIKLSMLNSGLLPTSRFNGTYYFTRTPCI